MAASRAGIKQIVLCDAGTMSGTPAGITAIGLREKASLQISPFKAVNDYRERSLRNHMNFQAKVNVLQTSMKLLKSLIDHSNANMDCQIVTVPQTSSAGSDDVFQFASATAGLGIDFEYLITNDKKSLSLTMERSFEYDVAKALIDAADSATAVSFTGVTGDGGDFTAFRVPYLLQIESPKSTALFGVNDILERTLSIKTKGKKTLYNQTLVDYLTVDLTIKASEASISKIVSVMGTTMSPSIYMKEGTVGGVFFDAFDIPAGVLTMQDDYMIGDDERSITVKFTGDVPIYDCSFTFGATGGEDASNTAGAKGGTMKIGA